MKPLFILPILFILLNTGCKTSSSLDKQLCKEGLPNYGYKHKFGPIRFRIHIDTIQIGQKIERIDSSFNIKIDKESPVVLFNDEVALKFFLVKYQQYGSIVHELKYDIFLKYGNCWRIWTSNSSSISSNPKLGNKTFSGTLSVPEKEQFVKVVWSMYAIN